MFTGAFETSIDHFLVRLAIPNSTFVAGFYWEDVDNWPGPAKYKRMAHLFPAELECHALVGQISDHQYEITSLTEYGVRGIGRLLFDIAEDDEFRTEFEKEWAESGLELDDDGELTAPIHK